MLTNLLLLFFYLLPNNIVVWNFIGIQTKLKSVDDYKTRCGSYLLNGDIKYKASVDI